MHRLLVPVLCVLALGACAFVPEPRELDFGEVVVGSRSPDQAVAWRNTDAAGGKTIDRVDVFGPFHLGAPFAKTRVAAGNATAPMALRFEPHHEGRYLDRAYPVAEWGHAIGIDLRLTGVGVLPVVPSGADITALAPGVPARGDVDFGDVPVGARAYRTVTLRNPGATSQVVKIAYTGKPELFSAAFMPTGTPLAQVTLAAGSAVTLTLAFAPKAPGSFVDFASFATQSGSLHSVLRLSGRGRAG